MIESPSNVLVHVVANHVLDCIHYLFAVISIREISGLFITATILVIKWRQIETIFRPTFEGTCGDPVRPLGLYMYQLTRYCLSGQISEKWFLTFETRTLLYTHKTDIIRMKTVMLNRRGQSTFGWKNLFFYWSQLIYGSKNRDFDRKLYGLKRTASISSRKSEDLEYL